MNKIIDIKLTSVCSPTCQTLIYETVVASSLHAKDNILSSCTELLVVRLRGTVIAFSTFDVTDGIHITINSLHFRNILKDRTFAEFWVSRYLQRYLRKKSYMQFLLTI